MKAKLFTDGGSRGNPGPAAYGYVLETVFPEELQEDVIAALRRAHPYEEPAFDVYALL